MLVRLTGIDETNRHSHFFLEEDDRCACFGEFDAGVHWDASPTNQLIANFKRPPPEIAASAHARRLQRHKNAAMHDIARALRQQFSPMDILCLTFVPIPPSSAIGDPAYCDRLERTLWMAFSAPEAFELGYRDADIRLLLRQTRSIRPDHLRGRQRCRFDELLAITQIDRAQLDRPVRERIVLFDDVLTSGKHFKVGKTRLREALPQHPVLGLFVARVVHADPPSESPFDTPDCPGQARAPETHSRKP